MNIKKMLLAVFACSALFIACDKDDIDNNRNAKVNIRLTDDPCDCQQVNIDIREIQVKTAEDSSQWLSLTTYNGIYDLLQFQDDVDTLIASGQIPAVELQEVRFVLGDQNTVMVDSQMYALKTPSAHTSGLKVKINKHLVPDSIYTFLLDFDAAESVRDQNGEYILHPVIHLK